MARLMAVTHTEDPVRRRIKFVTRRTGWRFLRPGAELCLCRKVQGRKAGEPLVRIAHVLVVKVSREPLSAITPQEVALEGFPGMSPAEFVGRFFVDAQGITDPDAEVTRIEWEYLDGLPAETVRQRHRITLEPTGSGQLRLPVHPAADEPSSAP